MTETITIGDQDYEVLTIDRISEITHARLAGGKVVEAFCGGYGIVRTNSPTGQYAQTLLGLEELEPFGIQPLKLIERVPVEFDGVTKGYQTDSRHGGFNVLINVSQEEVNRLSELGVALNAKFRCVQITEEA